MLANLFEEEVIMKVCTKCRKKKPLDRYYKQSTGRYGRRSDCKECVNKRNKQWHINNRSQSLANSKKHYYANKEQRMVYYHNYRAKEYNLPANLTLEEYQKAWAEQGGVCLFSHQSNNLSMEHFIPISWGIGLGTSFGNIVFMDRWLNKSKGNHQPFHWIKYQSRYVQKHFYNVLIPMLAERNQMTTKEFEEYVDSCYMQYIKNK
jgi:hypothetical protein